MKHSKYPHLFEPILINKMMVKNRIYSAPIGSVTDKSISGIGMIMKGTRGNVIGGRSRFLGDPDRNVLTDIVELDKTRELLSVVRQRGAKASFEVLHCGLNATVNKGDYAIGPCSLTREDGVEVRCMDEAMMLEVIDNYAKTCLIIKQLGFDMITLHFAHGWLPAQFLSPLWNHRKDEYGGSFENRIKFPTMIVDKVREKLGPDFPIDMRISVCEYAEGSINPEEAIEFVASIQDKIDMVNISGGFAENIDAVTKLSTSPFEPHNVFVHWSELMKKKVTRIPVAVVGAIFNPEDAEEIIASRKADIVVIGRQLISDPFWVKKAWEGRSEDIVPCIRCMNCWNEEQGVKGLQLCSVAPRYRREGRVPVTLPLADVKKNVVIIGGGPAGMKAAIVAHERGHKVTLIEKSDRLGGQIKCADYEDYKTDLKRYKEYLITQINKSKIRVILNKEATPEFVKELAPNCIIIAVGAKPTIPTIKGVNKKNVLQAIDVYTGKYRVGRNVAIIGGGTVGSELALNLSQSGHMVTIIEITGELNAQANNRYKHALNKKLSGCKDLRILLKTQTNEINEKYITVTDQSGKEITIEVDTVILATGLKPDFGLNKSFFGIVQDTNVIGDANRVATVLEATEDGYFVSASL